MAAFVLGATGNQGSATVEGLLRRGITVFGLTRSTKGSEAMRLAAKGARMLEGNVEDPLSLAAHFRASGASTLFVVTSFQSGGKSFHGQEVKQGLAVAEAIKRTKEQWALVLYATMTGMGLGKTGVQHQDDKIDVRDALSALGVPFAEIRPAIFMENWLTVPEIKIKTEGKLGGLLAPDVRAQFVSTKDVGELAAIMMSDPPSWAGRVLEAAGDECTSNQIADVLTRIRSGVAHPMRWKYSAAPRFLIRIFANELALMTDVQERPAGKNGFVADVNALRKLHPGLRTWEMFLVAEGLATKELAKPGCCTVM